jgi:hypothetical protein
LALLAPRCFLRFYYSERQSGRLALVICLRRPTRPFVSASKASLSTRPFLRPKVLLAGDGFRYPPLTVCALAGAPKPCFARLVYSLEKKPTISRLAASGFS